MRQRNQARGIPRDGIISAERLQHGPVELVPAIIADSSGRPARPYRAIDTLTIMERRGSITAGMRQAGEDFRRRFAAAQLDPLRALDLSRLSLGDKPTRRDSYALTIAAPSGQTIDGAASVALGTLYAALRVVFIGSNQWVVA